MKLKKKQFVTASAIGLMAISFSTLADAGTSKLWSSLKKPASRKLLAQVVTSRTYVGSVDGSNVYKELSTDKLKTAKLIFESENGTTETTIDASMALTVNKDGEVIGYILDTNEFVFFRSEDGVIVSGKMGGGAIPPQEILPDGTGYMDAGGGAIPPSAKLSNSRSEPGGGAIPPMTIK
jgi:hypothetical protein